MKILYRFQFQDGSIKRWTVKRMAELKPMEVIMRIDFAGTDGKQICAHAEKVQELVRCKDCRWYEIYQLKKDGTDDRRYNPSYCTLLRHNFTPDWFCADGEKRDE